MAREQVDVPAPLPGMATSRQLRLGSGPASKATPMAKTPVFTCSAARTSPMTTSRLCGGAARQREETAGPPCLQAQRLYRMNSEYRSQYDSFFTGGAFLLAAGMLSRAKGCRHFLPVETEYSSPIHEHPYSLHIDVLQ